MKSFFLILMSLALCASAAFAQSTASITGTVHDSSGAVVPGARVIATNLGTGAARSTQTGDTGDYVLTNLGLGDYQITVEATNFKRFVRRPIPLSVDQTARVDASLSTGDVTESVTVTGGAPLIESEKSAIAQVIDNKTIVELPLNGRNFIQLGSLIPGATGGAPGNSTITSRQGGFALSVNGQRAEYNNYLLDGLDNNEADIGLAVIIPSIDAIQEFKVQTANYSAEFGRASGAIVQVATKGGSNQFHGTAYDFIRNQIFDATNKFSAQRDPLHRNQFGFSIGGPVWIPKIYNGHNRTFFFFNSEWLRLRQGFTGNYIVPTSAQRSGDFTGLATIYDPLNVVGGKRQPFSGNMIPASRLNAISQKILAGLPLPNNGNPARNYQIRQVAPTNSNQQTIRLDQAITQRDQLFIRLSRSDSTQDTPALPYNGLSILNHPRGFVVGYTRIFSSKIVNDVRIGAQRYRFDDIPDSLGVDYPSQLGLPVYGADSHYLQYPGLSVSNITSISSQSALPLFRAENTFQYADTVTIGAGRHSLAIGGDYRAYQFNNYQPQTLSGAYTFTGVFTGSTGSTYANGIADFLLGYPVTQQILNGTGYASEYIRNRRFNLFVQDDFRATEKLTINAGLRYERDGRWTDHYDRWAYFDQDAGQIVYPLNATMSYTTFPYPYRFEDMRAIKRPSNLGFSPRLGFAYRPFGDNTTVIRGAYGLFQGQPTANPVQNAATAPPFFLRQTITSGSTTPQYAFGSFPSASSNSLLPTIPSFITIDPRVYRNAYIQQWNLGIEKQISDFAVKISYVGSKGTHLDMRSEINPAYPPGPGAVQSRRKFPLFGAMTLSNSVAWTNYNALQVSGEKHLSHGLEFLASYTYSKSLDSADGWPGMSNENSIAQDPYNFRAEYGRSSTDLRHRFTLSMVYLVPSFSSSRLVNTVAGGWQLSGLLVLQTGFPFTVLVPSDVANIGQYTTSERAQQIGDPHISNPSANKWFNTAAFALPSAYTFGNQGRNTLDGPGTRSLDMGLMKFFTLYNETKLQFRAEFFNLPNHPNLGLPNNSFGNAALGTISSADSRIGQLALKLIF
jgi:hypothetical protein